MSFKFTSRALPVLTRVLVSLPLVIIIIIIIIIIQVLACSLKETFSEHVSVAPSKK